MRLSCAIFVALLVAALAAGLPRASWGAEAMAYPMPLAYSVSTYCEDPAMSPDYTVPAAWASATQGDLVTARCGQVLDVLPPSPATGRCGINWLNFYPPFTGITLACALGETDADYFRVIRGAPDYPGYDGCSYNNLSYPKPAGIAFWDGAGLQGYKISIHEDYACVYNLFLEGGNACKAALIHIQNGANVRICGNIFRGLVLPDACGFKTSPINFISLADVNGEPCGAAIVNNIFTDLGPDPLADPPFTLSSNSGAVRFQLSCNQLLIYNNTFQNCERPGEIAMSNDPIVRLINNITYENNASDSFTISGVPGAGEYTAMTNATTGIVWKDQDGDNLHITRASTGAVNQGTDLHEDACFPFNIDLDGQVRPDQTDSGSPSWDIGADELVGALWKKIFWLQRGGRP